MRVLRWALGGLILGWLAGALAGLLRGRRVTATSPTYIPPDPARDHRSVGPRREGRSRGG